MKAFAGSDEVIEPLEARTLSSSERDVRPVAERGILAQVVEATKRMARRKRAFITRFL